nr:dyskerin-like protein [Tanacetum cinerariifolium]
AIFVKSLADRMYVSGQPHVDALIEKHLLEKNNDNVFSLPMLPENGLNQSCEEYLRDFEAENKLNEMITSSGGARRSHRFGLLNLSRAIVHPSLPVSEGPSGMLLVLLQD